ncbi:MAG: AtpZ/AtpI family protein [Anaerolineaceae bacterium]|nr:AtpZ/AtpI family protein [Anaerolineaceae bacterium]
MALDENNYQNEEAKRKAEERRIWRESLASISVGWELALPMFGGVILGQLIDRFIGTTYIFTIGLLLFGIVSGYYNLARAIQRIKSEKKNIDGEVEYKKFEEDELDDIDELW